jgi:hydrogenase maturation protease
LLHFDERIMPAATCGGDRWDEMTSAIRPVLILGYGNPGRRDDGLGPALADAAIAMGIEGVTVVNATQLHVEHAALIAEHDVAILADADVSCPAPFVFRPLEAREEVPFTTHLLSPEVLLTLAHRYYDAKARGYLLGIRGYEFDGFGEELSERARKNLDAAVRFLGRALASGRW